MLASKVYSQGSGGCNWESQVLFPQFCGFKIDFTEAYKDWKGNLEWELADLAGRGWKKEIRFKDVNKHTIFGHGDEYQTIMGVVGHK